MFDSGYDYETTNLRLVLSSDNDYLELRISNENSIPLNKIISIKYYNNSGVEITDKVATIVTTKTVGKFYFVPIDSLSAYDMTYYISMQGQISETKSTTISSTSYYTYMNYVPAKVIIRYKL